ncbi:hypothetical protein, conserved [Trypanosoma brucei gambiense DAL972]|uniref:Uncharacterized protein n=1 Tax=Trypanosoma brucei gambiense (strain MHOM/CI/86/DAL972) TaxID=679716 RepID=C9ZQZ0_TRYB9|nr:hypothetical protein, conserved [Trypanosoma brucei gambiense DAL972]CBH11820.1 hypothetical protein, conserved [Trypanosoma brucei gambiense DAL972]|eukprot:XP_011774105.1 hypothetical protein, conserved [Trypanosoma brucei gambiense DAL972]
MESTIMSIETVCISLYQCSPSLTTCEEKTRKEEGEREEEVEISVPHLCGHSFRIEKKDHRGDVLIPFKKGCTTYRELATGLAFRLNQYFVVHPSDSRQPHRPVSGLHSRASSYGRVGAGGRNCGCCFRGGYFCVLCGGEETSDGTVHGSSTTAEAQEIMEQYPQVVIRHFLRVSQPGGNGDALSYEVVGDDWKVEERHICCFFSLVTMKGVGVKRPIRTVDGRTIRPKVGNDHLEKYDGECSLARSEKHVEGTGYVEVKAGDRLLRIAYTDNLLFEDVVDRLRRRNLHVQRLFDGLTGASILPCELVRHFKGRLRALCATVASLFSGLPVTQGVSEGAKRRREWSDGLDVGTIISVSEERFYEGSGGKVLLSSTSPECETLVYDEADGSGLWTAQQLRQQTVFEISDDSSTAHSLPDPPQSRGSTRSSAASAKCSDDFSRTPHVGDDILPSLLAAEITLTHMKRRSSEAQGTSTDTLLTLRDQEVLDDKTSTLSCTGEDNETDGDAECEVPLPTNEADFITDSFIMVTQQTLPEIYFDNSDEEENE